jgi:hypothetical protein
MKLDPADTDNIIANLHDEVRKQEAEIGRLREALAVARQDILGHYLDDCGDHCENAIAKIEAALDWNEVMRGYGGARPDDNDPVQITRGTARLARAALHTQNEFDYYHNFGAAERELLTALGE